jgi:NhaC family Na+:H+ antiporter
MNKTNDISNEQIKTNRELNIWEALVLVFALLVMLAFMVSVYGDYS